MFVLYISYMSMQGGKSTLLLGSSTPNHHRLPPSPPRQRASSQRHCCVQGLHDASEGLELTLRIKMKIDRIDASLGNGTDSTQTNFSRSNWIIQKEENQPKSLHHKAFFKTRAFIMCAGHTSFQHLRGLDPKPLSDPHSWFSGKLS